MNAGQKRVVALALQYIRETKPDAYGLGLADSWTEADWDLWHKANPLPAESQRMMKMLLPVRQPVPHGRGSDRNRDHQGAVSAGVARSASSAEPSERNWYSACI